MILAITPVAPASSPGRPASVRRRALPAQARPASYAFDSFGRPFQAAALSGVGCACEGAGDCGCGSNFGGLMDVVKYGLLAIGGYVLYNQWRKSR